MPFYEYQCQACGAHHEALQKMSDPPVRRCPGCGKAKLVRLMSAPAFRLKGGGWYETDFKSDQDRKRNLHGDDTVTPPAVVADKSAKADSASATPDASKTAKAETAKPAVSATQKPPSGGAGQSAARGASKATRPAVKAKKPAAKPAKGR